MTNRNLLKEAIADAKAVKETAIANAKAALEEAFTPHLKSMLAAKLEEMDKDEDVEEAMHSKKEEDMMEEYGVSEKKDEIEEEFDLNEILAELEEDKANESLILEKSKTLKFKEWGIDNHVELNRLMNYLRDEDINWNQIGQSLVFDSVKDATKAKEFLGESELDLIAEEYEAKKEDMDEAKDMEMDEAKDMEMDGMGDEEVDLEDMTEDDLKSFIEDVIADMVATGELEAGEEFEAEMGGEEMEADDEMGDMEELDEMDEVSWNEKNNPARGATLDKLAPTKVGQTTPAYAVNEKISESSVSEAMDPQTIEMIASALGPLLVGGSAFAIDKAIKALKAGKAGKVGQALANQLEKVGSAAGAATKSGQATGTFEGVESELKEIEELKKELQEVNLLNAKLLYTNKIFNSKNLNESQKLRVLKAFDKVSSVKEAKIIFETLNEGMVSKTVKSSMVNEIKSSASKATGFIHENRKPIVEVDPMVARWQKLAGIK